MELAVVSCSVETTGSVSLWNPFNSTLISSYLGGGVCGNRSLVANGGYIISAQREKPLLHAWALNRQYRLNKRLIAPGKITCLDVSPDLRYVVVGVQNRIHIYQTSSGLLCGSKSEHFQYVRIVRFNSDGSLIGSAGEDGLLVIHNLCHLLDKSVNNPAPFFTTHSHSLPITDFFFTSGGMHCRVVTCSIDLCIKIHDLSSKQLLYNGVFERQLTALALSPAESCFFVGDYAGRVHIISLLNPPREIDNHYVDKGQSFQPHEQQITALSCSIDSLHLLSASLDRTVRLTHIPSRQILQTIQMKGPVNNCFFYIPPLDMLSDSFSPSIPLYDFISNPSSETTVTFNLSCFEDIIPEDIDRHYSLNFREKISMSSAENPIVESDEITKLRKVNNEIFQYALVNIFNRAHKHQKPMNDVKTTVKAATAKKKKTSSGSKRNSKKKRKQ